MNEVRCNEWDCPNNKNGVCIGDTCPNLEEFFEELLKKTLDK